jgi:hypothetical protein
MPPREPIELTPSGQRRRADRVTPPRAMGRIDASLLGVVKLWKIPLAIL